MSTLLIRKPLLYPLSYEGATHQGTCQRLSPGVSNGHRLSAATEPAGDRTPITPAVVILLDGHERASSLNVHGGAPTLLAPRSPARRSSISSPGDGHSDFRCRADGRACAGPAARRRPGPGAPSLAPLRSCAQPVALTPTVGPLNGRTTGTLDPTLGVLRTTRTPRKRCGKSPPRADSGSKPFGDGPADVLAVRGSAPGRRSPPSPCWRRPVTSRRRRAGQPR